MEQAASANNIQQQTAVPSAADPASGSTLTTAAVPRRCFLNHSSTSALMKPVIIAVRSRASEDRGLDPVLGEQS